MDRFEQAKTIDLCQNPLTVCALPPVVVCCSLTRPYAPSVDRKNPSSRERGRFQSGRRTTGRLRGLRDAFLVKERSVRPLCQRKWTSWQPSEERRGRARI